ncbi:MAG: DUF4332 domain-containing protein [Anaerolineales bacterium]|nr:DUF4332 domain-containing protein [Anaerolineales bacterium]
MSQSKGAGQIRLEQIRKRIEETDLVPSRMPLLDGIGKACQALKGRGIGTLAGLRGEWKSAARLNALAKTAGLDPQYLALLRREVESWFPKPCPLTSFGWLPKAEIAKFEKAGIRDAAELTRAAGTAAGRAALAKYTRADPEIIRALFRCADLTRVQWVSPTAARMLVEAGVESAAGLAQADAERLCAALERVNAGGKFFKGKIGLRDVKRLIRAAGYLWTDC